MSHQQLPKLNLHQQTRYRIIVQGTLSQDWSDYFSGFTYTSYPKAKPVGVTILSGVSVDQPMLLGTLNHLHALGLPLLKVEWL